MQHPSFTANAPSFRLVLPLATVMKDLTMMDTSQQPQDCPRCRTIGGENSGHLRDIVRA
jgi:hypothetical protein